MNPKTIVKVCILVVSFTLAQTETDKATLISDIATVKAEAVTEEFSSAKLQKSLDDIKTAIGNIENPSSDDDEEKKRRRDEKLTQFGAVVTGTSSSIKKFASGQTGQIISGVLDLTSMALTVFGGPIGAAIGTVMGLISNLFVIFMKSPVTKPSVGQIINDALNDFRDTELYDRMDAFATTFNSVHGGLTAVIQLAGETEGNNLQSSDIILLKTEIQSFQSSVLLEEVKSALRTDIVSGRHDHAKKSLKSLNMYSKLIAILELVVWEFIACITGEGTYESYLPAYYRAFMEQRRIQDKEFLKFLHQPTAAQGLIAAIYQHRPDEYPALKNYVSVTGVVAMPDTPLLTINREIYLRPKRWPGHYAYVTSDPATKYWVYGWDSSSMTRQGLFTLKTGYYSSEKNLHNVFTLRSKYYSYKDLMALKYNGCRPLSYPATVNEVLTAGKNEASEKYSTYGTRNCYQETTYDAYDHLNNKISRNYLWQFTKIKVDRGNCPYYLISAVNHGFGPDYLLEMRDTNSGALRLHRGYPGDSALWKIGSCS